MTSVVFKFVLSLDSMCCSLLLCSLLLLIRAKSAGSFLPETREVGALSLRLQALEARKIRPLLCVARLLDAGEAGALSLRLRILEASNIRALRVDGLVDCEDGYLK